MLKRNYKTRKRNGSAGRVNSEGMKKTWIERSIKKKKEIFERDCHQDKGDRNHNMKKS